MPSYLSFNSILRQKNLIITYLSLIILHPSYCMRVQYALFLIKLDYYVSKKILSYGKLYNDLLLGGLSKFLIY
jgi:hypothetical protein